MPGVLASKAAARVTSFLEADCTSHVVCQDVCVRRSVLIDCVHIFSNS